MAVILAGALVNIVFALICFFILQTVVADNVSTKIEELVPEYSAQKAGLEPGDTILSIDEKKVNTTDDINKIIEKTAEKQITVEVLRNEEKIQINLIPTKIEYPSTGIYLKSQNGEGTTKILTLDKGAAADRAGLKANDVILKINNKEIEDNAQELIDIINRSKDKELVFNIKRGKEILDITVKPDTISKYYLGVYFAPAEKSFTNNIYYAAIDTKDFLLSIFDNLKQIFTGKVSFDQMMGPVGISEAVSQTSGVEDFVYMLCLVSLSLGVTNLLPILPLDGGKFVLIIIEGIRRKPFEEKTQLILQLIGMIFFVFLFIYVTSNDIARLF